MRCSFPLPAGAGSRKILPIISLWGVHVVNSIVNFVYRFCMLLVGMVIYSWEEAKGRRAAAAACNLRDVIFVSLSRHRIRPSHNEIIWRRRRRRRIAFSGKDRQLFLRRNLGGDQETGPSRPRGRERAITGWFSSPISLCWAVQRGKSQTGVVSSTTSRNTSAK